MRSSPPLVRTLPATLPTPYPSAWDKWIVLPITLSVMVAQPLVLLYMLALGRAAIIAPADMLIVVLLTLGASWIIMLVDAGLAQIRQSGDGLSNVALSVVGWIVAKIIFANFDPPLFGVADGIGAHEIFTFLNVILLTVTYWLGYGFARELGATSHAEHRFLLTVFRAGIAIITGVIVCAIATNDAAILTFLPLSLPLFVVSGGIAVALGNIISSRLGQSQPEDANAGDNPWHGFLNSVGFATVVIALLLETVAAAIMLRVLAPLWEGILQAVRWLLFALNLLLTPIYAFFNWLLHLFKQPPPHISTTHFPSGFGGTPIAGGGGSGSSSGTPIAGSGGGSGGGANGTPSPNGTPQGGTNVGGGTGTGGGNGTPGAGTPEPKGTPSPNGTPGPGGHGGNSTPIAGGHGTPIPGGQGTPGASGTPSANGTPGIGTGGTNGTPSPNGTPQGGAGGGGNTGTPGTGGNGIGDGTPSSTHPTTSPAQAGNHTATPTPTTASHHSPSPADIPAWLVNVVAIMLVVLVVAALALLIVRAWQARRKRATRTGKTARTKIARQPKPRRSPPVENLPPTPARAYYYRLLRAATAAGGEFARRASETPVEYARRLRQLIGRPEYAQQMAPLLQDPDVRDILDDLTRAYVVERYREDTLTPQQSDALRMRMPRLLAIFRR
jgi:hypothetical protein